MKPFMVLAVFALLAPIAGANDYVNGDWFIITGKAKLTSSIAKHPLIKDSAKWVKDGTEVRVLALPSDSAWVARLTNGAWWGVDLPGSLWDKNGELTKANRDIEAIALMAQGGWAMLHDQGQLATDGVPPAIHKQLQNAVADLKKAKDRPRFLAFAPDGGWVLLGEKDYREHGLPRELSASLEEQRKLGNAIRCVAFDSRGDWFIVNTHNNLFSSNSKHPVVEKVKALQSAGEKISLITFTPGFYPRGYVLQHKPVRRVEVTMTTKYTCPEGKVERWAVLPPAFPELARQHGIKLSFEPAAVPVEDGGPLKQRLHIMRVAGRPKALEAKVHCDMTLCTNRMVPLLANQAPPNVEISPAHAKIFTHATHDMETKIFKNFVAKRKLTRGPKESEIDFARRTFLEISKDFTYLYPCVEGKDVIEVGKGDCGGLSWVFVRRDADQPHSCPSDPGALGRFRDAQQKKPETAARRSSPRQGGVLRAGPWLGRCRSFRRRRRLRQRQSIRLLRQRARRLHRLRSRSRPRRHHLGQRPPHQARRLARLLLVVPGGRQEHPQRKPLAGQNARPASQVKKLADSANPAVQM